MNARGTAQAAHTRAGIREAILYNRQVAAQERESDGYYRVDRSSGVRYFGGLPKWESKILAYLRSLNERGERAVYADVCGRADGALLGASKSYSFSLQKAHWISWERHTHVQGDIFNAKEFYSFLALLRKNGDRPALVTFEPMAGLQSHTPFESPTSRRTTLHPQVSYRRLENNLRKLIGAVRPGGFIFLDKPFQFGGTDLGDFLEHRPLDQYQSFLWLKALCKEMRCSIEIGTILGPRHLIRKYAKAK